MNACPAKEIPTTPDAVPLAIVRWAILENRYPEDIVRLAQKCLGFFQTEPSLYDSPGLKGPAKHAELTLKLCYWLALSRLTLDQFREWQSRIPDHDNEGWDVDLCKTAPGSPLPSILRLGPFIPRFAVPASG